MTEHRPNDDADERTRRARAPGLYAHFELAPRDAARGVEDLAPEFFRTMFGVGAGDVLWTDESYLDDFVPLLEDLYGDDTPPTIDGLYDRIARVYGVDVRDVTPPTIVGVLAALRDRGGRP